MPTPTRLWLWLFLPPLLCPASLLGQGHAALSGCVRDPAGAVVPGAALMVWNQETGLSRAAETDHLGGYLFANLQPGMYEISVSASGFRKLARSGIRLHAAERVSLDVMLQIGRVEETVIVDSREEALQASSGYLRGTVDQRRLDALPLNGRDVTPLLQTQAGVLMRDRSASEGTGFVVNGSRQNGVHYSLDGGTNTDSYRHLSGVFPNASAIAEVNIERGNMSAEHGNTSGAVVSVVTRSGSNAIHGAAFEYLRNGLLNARDFFATQRDNLKRSQFGATLGGPILRNRLFFFVSYQGTRSRSDNSLTRQYLPTAAARQGDFSTLSRILVDPLTLTPFPSNRIPITRLSSVSNALLRYIPVPASTAGDRMVSIRDRTGENEALGRVDWQTRVHRVAGHWFRRQFETPFSGNRYDLASMYTPLAGRTEQPYVHYTLTDAWTISPSMIHSTTFTIRGRRTFNDWRSVELPIDFARAGVRNIAVKNPAALYVSVNGYFLARPGWNYDKRDRDIQAGNLLTWVHGRHELKGGSDLLWVSNDIRNDYRTMGSFEFNGATSGDSMADFLLGEVYQFWQGGGEYKKLHGLRGALFVQDEWRPSARLTLSAGLRWEPFEPFQDSLGRTQCFVPGVQSVRFARAPLGYLNAGDPDCPAGGFRPYRGSFAPRLGFAWRPRGSDLVIRGGAGAFWNPPFTMLYNGFVNSAPFSPQVTRNGLRFEDPYAGAVNPFPASFAPFDAPRDATFATPMGQFGAFETGYRPAYSESVNLTVERRFAGNWVARSSYVANLGRRVSFTYDRNYARYAPGATAANLQQRRPYADFASIVLAQSGSNTSYHAGELSIARRAASGLLVEAAYTWSKSIDEYSEESRPGQSASIAVPYSRRAVRAVSDFDVKHLFVASWVWPVRLPFASSRWLQPLLAGWTTAGLVTLRGGLPFSVRSGTDRALSGIGLDFADLTGEPLLVATSRSQRVARYFNPSAFRLAALGTFGDSPRNLLRGPGSVNVDLALARQFRVREWLRTELRAEFFNALNRANFGNPSASFNNATSFGRIETSSPARVIQGALHWRF